MKTLKKVIALLLAVLMITAVSPAVLAADANATGIEIPVAQWVNNFGAKQGEGSLTKAIANVSKNGKVVLIADITLDESIEITKDVTLDGKGFTILRAEALGGDMIAVKNGAKLTLSNVTVDGNSKKASAGTGKIITVENGNVTLGGNAVLCNNVTKTNNGGAVSIGNKGVLTMTDGSEINGCTAVKGGAVEVKAYGAFNMNGGLIAKCSANEAGGAVYNANGSSVTKLSNAEISQCTVRNGAGSAIDSTVGELHIENSKITNCINYSSAGAVTFSTQSLNYIGGASYIYDNVNAEGAQNNVYVPNNAKITFLPALSGSAKVGISTVTPVEEGAAVTFISSPVDGFVYSDVEGYAYCTVSSAIAFVKYSRITFNPGNGVCNTKEMVVPAGSSIKNLPNVEQREGFEFKGWFTEDGQAVTSEMTAPEGDVTFVAKWENLNALDMNPLAVIGRFFERIGDLMRMVFDFLKNMFTGNGDNALENVK